MHLSKKEMTATLAKLITVQLKVLIYETLQTQRDFTKFLKKIGERYGRLVNEEEAYESATLMRRASEMIDRLTEIMDNATITISESDNPPPDKLLVYPPGGLCIVWVFPHAILNRFTVSSRPNRNVSTSSIVLKCNGLARIATDFPYVLRALE